jgi:hypothetical protein
MNCRDGRSFRARRFPLRPDLAPFPFLMSDTLRPIRPQGRGRAHLAPSSGAAVARGRGAPSTGRGVSPRSRRINRTLRYSTSCPLVTAAPPSRIDMHKSGDARLLRQTVELDEQTIRGHIRRSKTREEAAGATTPSFGGGLQPLFHQPKAPCGLHQTTSSAGGS